jgi:lambda family phage tail tape measure protein
MLATEKFNIAKKEEATWREQTRKAIDDELDTLIAKTRADRDAVDALQLQVDQYGLSADALQALSAARDRDTAATLRQRAAMLDSARDGGAIADQYRQQADAVERLANLKGTLAAKQARDHNDPLAGVDRAFKDYMDDVKRAGDATYGAVSNAMRGLEDLGVQALSGGKLKSAARQLVSGLLSEFERLYIIRPLIASIAGGGSGSGSSGWFGAASSLLRGYLSGGLSIDTSGYSANGGLGYASAAGISGGRAAGGGVDAGKSYLVGEKGPEVLRMGGQSGTVIPNDALGGGTRVDNRIGTINVGAGVTRGEMYSAIQAANAQQEMRQRRLSRQGSWA